MLWILSIAALGYVVAECSHSPAQPSVFPEIPSATEEWTWTVRSPVDGFRSFRPWCSNENACPAFNLIPYNAATATDLTIDDGEFQSHAAFSTLPRNQAGNQGSWVFLQQSFLPELLPLVGANSREYRFSFSFRQNAQNSVENIANRLPRLTIRFQIARNTDFINMTDPHMSFPPVSALPLIINGVRQNSLSFSSQTKDWTQYEALFSIPESCLNCRIVLNVEQDSWTSYWGNMHYISNVTVTELPRAIELDPLVHVSSHEVVHIPVMEYSPRPNRTESCSWMREAQDVSDLVAHYSSVGANVRRWADPSVWPNGELPKMGAQVSIPPNTTIFLRGCEDLPGNFSIEEVYASMGLAVALEQDSSVLSSPRIVQAYFESLTIPSSSALIILDGSLSIAVRSIEVMGQLLVGHPDCPIYQNITIQFLGERAEHREKGMMVNGGRFEAYGKEYYGWVRLARTVYAGDRFVYLQEPVDWEPGQQIVLTSTIFRTLQRNENEVRTIRSLHPSGKIVYLDRPVAFLHYAGVEIQGEVGLLSRTIQFHGERAFAQRDYGGHSMVMNGGVGIFKHVAAVRMGQLNTIARYPLHFHLLGNSEQSLVWGSSIVESFYRCVVVHGTHGMTVQGNNAYNVHGSCYYLEDGVEEGNFFRYNLVSQVNTIFTSASGVGQFGEVHYESDALRNPSDVSAAGFYITNAMNTFEGNVASGGWTGYSFPNLPRPIGLFRHLDYSAQGRNPWNRDLLRFNGNTARSTASVWYESGGIYVGGRLGYMDAPNNRTLFYHTGRQGRETLDGEWRDAWMVFNNTLCAHTHRCIAHWGNRVEVHGMENHDSPRGLVVFGEALVKNALISARSRNSELVDLQLPPREGFEYYDTWVKTILVNVTFRGYDDKNGDLVFRGMTHSDTFKPQGINAMRGIRFQNCSRAAMYRINDVPTGASWMYNIVDHDGSGVGSDRPKIIGSHTTWWDYDPSCYRSEWDIFVCDKGGREIASLEITMPGLTRTEAEFTQIESHRQIGYMSLLSRPHARLVLTKNPGTTGVTREAWLMELFAGSPTAFQIDVVQIPRDHFIVLVVPYPAGTSFEVNITQRYFGGGMVSLPAAASLFEVMDPEETIGNPTDFDCQQGNILCRTNGRGPQWFFNGSHLFLRVVDVSNYANGYYRYRPDVAFSRDGITMNSIELGFFWSVRAVCGQVCQEDPAIHAETCAYPGVDGLVETTQDVPKPLAKCVAEPEEATNAPSVLPTRSPTRATRRPTRGSSVAPTIRTTAPTRATRRPTQRPTKAPTDRTPWPTRATRRPTRRPTRRTTRPTIDA